MVHGPRPSLCSLAKSEGPALIEALDKPTLCCDKQAPADTNEYGHVLQITQNQQKRQHILICFGPVKTRTQHS